MVKVVKEEKVTYSIIIDGFKSEQEARNVACALQLKVMCGDTVLALCQGEVPKAIREHWEAARATQKITIEVLNG